MSGIRLRFGGLPLIFCVLSCSWYLKNTEELHYNRAAFALERTVTNQGVDKDCRYQFDLPPPSFESKENLDGKMGIYVNANKTIHYLKDQFQVIHHEAFHHLAENGENGPQTYYCLEQTGASLLSRIVQLEDKNRLLENRVRSLTRRKHKGPRR